MTHSIFGIPIVIECGRPRYQLPDDLPLPPAYRQKFNLWARDFLGSHPPLIGDGQSIAINGRLHMNRKTFEMIKHRVTKSTEWSGSMQPSVRARR